LVLLSLYSNKVNKYGAWAGILGGGLISATWPLLNRLIPYHTYPLVPAFFSSLLLILIVSRLTTNKREGNKHAS
jgi:Na+/pantothenate symporter